MKMKISFFRNSLLLSGFALISHILVAQSPVGTWKSIDDKTGKPKSYIKITEENGTLKGVVTKLLQKPQDAVCEKCTGERKGLKVVGMSVIWGLKKDGSNPKWKGGNIFDPESDNTYGCTIWFENGKTNELKLKGIHWTGLSRTQTWFRVNE
jgi:uncharacterized protein (DUF2147 family)